ncbi:hypothetical protein SAMN05421841_3631 [Chryseobacterium wanjuense]|jgi:hypothetical protein|uniref:DUF4148 domain-containing protein n=1 Tax=Chryseobacterium wanjuense TaxID=356305 RepID=A0A1I0S0J9_9FLAO|nr:hypothetical protein [Chryseobacterium wanjuense]SEW47813.1 hypothetical protein SAMN05421841_3631 [Chryseobacterium wanjuense]
MKNLLLGIMILASGLSFAQQREDINLRGERKRVVQGVRSGEINRREAAVIHNQAKDVKQAKRIAKADGVVTPRERAVVAREDRQLDRTIYRAKHN